MSSDTHARIPAPPGIPERAGALRIVPQRRFGRWAAAVVVLAPLGLAVNAVLRNKAFQWDAVAGCVASDPVQRGLWLTAVVRVLGFALGPVEVAVVGLTLHEAAYAADAVRGGFLSADRRQIEAAQALGLSRWRNVLPQAMRSVVPPAQNMLIGTLRGTSIVGARGSERAR